MRGWTPMQWVVAIILVAAAFAILYVALPAMGIALPAWFMQIMLIVLIAFVAIAAIGFLVKLWQGWGGPPTP